MKLIQAWSKRKDWNTSYYIPSYDREAIKNKTKQAPVWLHFGAGNIFRAFIAPSMDILIEAKKSDTGIIVCEGFDKELIDLVYRPYDCLSLLVTLKSDKSVDKRVVGSVMEAVTQYERMAELFQKESLQLVSFTITEKGYDGPLMSTITKLCKERYDRGGFPLALVSMDNCSQNGDKLRTAIIRCAGQMIEKNEADEGFLRYLKDETKVTFPWTMIDKITPRPDASVEFMLNEEGFEDTKQIITKLHTYTAPFVNAEETQYLVIEDNFPNGRPRLEHAGILFADRSTVDRAEKMKVGTCLNPLHTALAVFGCLLGYHKIKDEMQDKQLQNLAWKLGFTEGLPVVADPGIIKPVEFLNEVIEKRLPNPFLPDTPQRIATDTSQKIPVRFGQTLVSYCKAPELKPENLVFIPLVIAGWLRYLMGIDDNGERFERSPDPRLEELTACVADIHLGQALIQEKGIDRILMDRNLFGIDLGEFGLDKKVKEMFREMIKGTGAIRDTLKKYCGE